jgi:hypothetical protein
VERKADEFGLRVACQAVRQDPMKIGKIGDPLRAMQTFRDSLDEDFFAFDDACREDESYPSISHRKSSFASEFARCLFPDGEQFFGGIASDQTKGFNRLEEWLKSRQITGIVGSALYGVDAVYRYDVASTTSETHYLAFDSSGTRSQVSLTVQSPGGIAHNVLAEWGHAGDLIIQRGDADGAEFLVTMSAANSTTDVMDVRVTCASTEASCHATTSVRNIPDGTTLQGTSAGAIVEKSGDKLRTFATSRDFVDDKPVLENVLPVNSSPDEWIFDGTAESLVLARQTQGDKIVSKRRGLCQAVNAGNGGARSDVEKDLVGHECARSGALFAHFKCLRCHKTPIAHD